MAMGQEFNFVIDNENLKPNDDLIKGLFDLKSDDSMRIVPMELDFDMFDILVEIGLFRSKSEARKNWKRTGKNIPEGFTDIKNIGKLHHRLTIWNPIGGHDDES